MSNSSFLNSKAVRIAILVKCTGILPQSIEDNAVYSMNFALKALLPMLIAGIGINSLKFSTLADWAFSQGMYITGTTTPYDFYKSIFRHTLNGITPQTTQDVLLLAGEKDHYIPPRQFYRLKNNLPNAHSLTCRMFTEREGGEQHCQIGNHLIAVNCIVSWLDKYFKAENKR